MKNVLVILGGGRPHGNTDQLVDSFIKGSTEAGNNVIKVDLNKKKVNGCTGCNVCKMGKPCVQKDDFNEIAKDIKNADLLVFASPLYFWTISAKTKAFIERLYGLSEEDNNPPYGRYEKYPKKDCMLLMTSADNLFWTFNQAYSYYQFALIHYIGFTDKGTLLCGGCGGSLHKPNIQNTKWLDKAYDMGHNYK